MGISFTMDVMTAIKGRRSVRSFKSAEIETEKADALKDALVWAPSAGNLQSRRFYFVYNLSVKEKLVHAAFGQGFIREAPLVIVGCADLKIDDYYRERGMHLYCIEDVSCSIQNVMLAAYGMGLGSVWVAAFDEEMVLKALNMPPNLRPIAIVPIGYPNEEPLPPRRVSFEKAIVEIK